MGQQGGSQAGGSEDDEAGHMLALQPQPDVDAFQPMVACVHVHVHVHMRCRCCCLEYTTGAAISRMPGLRDLAQPSPRCQSANDINGWHIMLVP